MHDHTRILVLMRHGESAWNAQNRFTGWADPDLSALGCEEAQRAGVALRNYGFQPLVAHTSVLLRAQHTLQIVLQTLDAPDIPISRDPSLNERDYGQLTGINKDTARSQWGRERIESWRRSYTDAPPDGESLRDTSARVLPYFMRDILPGVLNAQPTLVVAHGNSLRALVMLLHKLSPETILATEIPNATPIIHILNPDTSLLHTETLSLPPI